MPQRISGVIRNNEAYFTGCIEDEVLKIIDDGSFDILVDTGFTGHITVSEHYMSDLELELKGSTKVRTSNGIIDKILYKAKVEINGNLLENILIIESDEFKIGMELMEDIGSVLKINFPESEVLLS